MTASPGGQTCSTSGALTCTIQGLTPNARYTATITATNAVGTSPAATVGTFSTPADLPGVVLNPTAVAGNAQATVSWTPPASNGGSPITSYTVTSSPGGRTCTYVVATTFADGQEGCPWEKVSSFFVW